MRTLKRILVFLEIIIIIFSTILIDNSKKVDAQINLFRQRPISIGVVVYNFEDKFISLVRESLEEIQKQNTGQVEFKFFDGKGNQAIQNEVISNVLSTERVDFLLVNLVNTQDTQQVINMVRSKNIPVIFFNREPVAIEPIKAYQKSFYVGTNAREAGMLQGDILIKLWNNDRKLIDKNNDGILQYIMLQGERSSIEAQERTQYSISTINNAGIKTEQLALSIGNWRRDLAKDAINSLFLQYSTRIEAIIANNDEMAIGAIEALQKYGYNKGDPTKNIPVFGIDGILAAQELIKKGFMTGTVFEDPNDTAEALYKVGLNLVYNIPPLEDTPYKFAKGETVIRIPYHGVITQSN